MEFLGIVLACLCAVLYIAISRGIFSWIVDKLIKKIKQKRNKAELDEEKTGTQEDASK